MSIDRELQKRVLAELTWEPRVVAAHIGVTAKGGVITLSGHVETYVQKFAAEQAVRRVKGVKAVAEEIEVRLPLGLNDADDDIAAAAANQLAWDVSLPRSGIVAKVEKGWITLTGQVEWHYQQQAAEQDVRGLRGVIGVTNRITLKPRVNTEHLSDDITHALGRSWFYDDESVHVRADSNGRVTLTGSVASLHDRDLASVTAWSTAGTTEVFNNISIS
jgi:osmotically-inducible protein OsmY